MKGRFADIANIFSANFCDKFSRGDAGNLVAPQCFRFQLKILAGDHGTDLATFLHSADKLDLFLTQITKEAGKKRKPLLLWKRGDGLPWIAFLRYLDWMPIANPKRKKKDDPVINPQLSPLLPLRCVLYREWLGMGVPELFKRPYEFFYFEHPSMCVDADTDEIVI
jgi:hypothetical protein